MATTESLTAIQQSLYNSAEALKPTWRLVKAAGFEVTAKETAGMILDLENTAENVGGCIERNSNEPASDLRH